MADHVQRYGYDEECGFPFARSLPVPVSDEHVLTLQARINAWLEEVPTTAARRLASLSAVLIPLLTPSMYRRGDPALLYALRTTRAPRANRVGAAWRDPLRVAAAVCAADQFLTRLETFGDIAQVITAHRILDHRDKPWHLNVMEWAYGPCLRPNPFLEELVHRQVVSIVGFS
ncbi:hypothetical protein [Streptomyces sp. 7N604]|uniref:hypothetical protein n=1 Tax=Streptomyces sp. 7N604 TaxID=3457415 RepID=UPI003FCEF5B1